MGDAPSLAALRLLAQGPFFDFITFNPRNPGRFARVSSLRRLVRITSYTSLAVATATCSQDSVILPSEGVPASMSVVDGNTQTGTAGSPLPIQLIVQVTDAKNRPVINQAVEFKGTSPTPGQLIPDTALTDFDGKAKSQWVLGTHAGTQTVRARVLASGQAGQLVKDFSATVMPDAPDTLLAVVGQNQTAPVGSDLADSLVVLITDKYGNPMVGQTVNWAVPTGQGSVSANITTTGIDGRAAVKRTLGPTSGNQTATATAGTLKGSPVTFVSTASSGGPAALQLTSGNNQVAPAGFALADSIVVRLVDGNGNGVPGRVTTFAVASGAGSVLPTGVTTDANGYAFTKWTLGPTAGPNSVTASAAGFSVLFSATGTASTPTKMLANSVLNQSGTAGLPVTAKPSVKLTDQNNNVVQGVTVTFRVTGGGGSVPDSTVTTDINGIATVGDWVLGAVAGVNTLEASAKKADGTALTGSPVTFTANAAVGVAAKLAFSQQPINAVAGAAISPAVTVLVQDASGNTVTTSNAAVTVALGANPGSGVLNGTLTQNAVNGVATFSGLSVTKVGIGYTLTAAATGLTGTTSSTFNIIAAGATQLAFTVQPTNTVAAQPIANIQVTVQDANGNPITTGAPATAQITLAIGNNAGPGGTLSGTAVATAVAGVATFSGLSIDKAGLGYTLSATSPGLTPATSAGFNIGAGAAAKLAFVVQPTAVAAGSFIAPAVQVAVQDAEGNLVTTSNAPISIGMGNNPGAGTLTGAGSVSAVGGIATFSALSINKTGTGYTLVATSPPLNNGTSAAFDVTPGSNQRLVFTTEPVNMVAGTVTPAIVVTVQDANGNTITGSTASITLAIGANPGTGTLTGGGPVAAVAGVATFNGVSINRSGNGYSLTASATGAAGATSTAFNVAPGAPNRVVFTQPPNGATAGAAITPTVAVSIQDANGNLVPTATNQVTLGFAVNPGAGTLTGGGPATPTTGVATFPTLSINKSGVGYRLTASGAGLTGADTSAVFNVTGAAPTQMAFGQQPTNTVANVIMAPAVTVNLLDQFGNPATVNNNSVTLAIASNPGGGTLSGSTTVIANSSGIATFANLSISKTGTGYTLSATSTGLTTATSTAFNITPAAENQVVFVQQPTSATAGAVIAPAITVAVQDNFGNVVTGSTSPVTLAFGNNAGGGTLSGTLTQNAVNGIATFSDIRINRAGSAYTLTASSGALRASTSSAFNIVVGPPTHMVFSVQPSASTVAGSPISPAVQVAIRDSMENTITGATTPITVTIGNNPSAGILTGGGATNAVSGVASFTNLRIDKAGTGYTLHADGGGLPQATSTAFDILVGTGNKLVFLVQPTSTTVGTNIAPPIQVQIQDGSGNPVTTATDSVLLAASVPGVLAGVTRTAAVGGIATFSSVRVNVAGTNYTLSALPIGTGLIGATSTGFNITAATTTTTITSDTPDPTVVGQGYTVAFGVTSTGGTPTGTVTISDGTDNCAAAAAASGNCVLTSNTAGAKTLVATYSGDANFGGSVSAGAAHTVNKANTITLITGDVPDPSVVGQTFMVNYTVAVSSPGAGTPTGNVVITVNDGSGATCTASVAAGGCQITFNTVGTKTITATYSGDAAYNGSVDTEAHQVNPASTTTTITGNTPDPSNVGQPVTFTFTVTTNAPGAGTPAGNVTVTDSAGTSCTTALAAGAGSCQLTWTTASPTPRNVVAVYAGNANFATSSSVGTPHTVNQTASTTAVVSSLNPSTYGQSLTLTATVTGAGATPTGSVQFLDGGVNLNGPVTLTAGSASLLLSGTALIGGVHAITASYSGDANYNVSTGTLSGGQTVNKAASTTTVASSSNPSVSGETVSWTATVTAGTTGTVQFAVDGVNLGTPVTLVNGVATSPTRSDLTVATHTITASYSGDVNFTSSLGTLTGGQVVNLASTTTAVGSSQNPSTFGQSVTFTATVATVAPGTGTPTGSIQFAIDGTNFGSPVTLAAGSATSPATATLASGNHTVTAAYTPTGTSFSASAGSLAGGQNVSAGNTATAVASSVNPSVFGQSVTLTATVTSGSGTPTGTVQFVIDGANSGTPVTLNAGVATQTTAALAAGNHPVSANYIPTGSFSASNGSLAGGQTVNPASTTASVSSSSVNSVYGTSVTFTAAVATVAPGSGTPTGTVQFAVDGSNLGIPVTLAGGVATSQAISTLNVGNHPVTVTYTATGSFSGSTGTLPGGQNVTPAPTTTVVASSRDTSVFGQSVTFTATLTSPGGPVSGAVQFSVDASAFGAPVTLVAGVATSSPTSALTVGNHSVTASYAATTNFSASSSSLTGGQVVTKANTATTLASSQNPSSFGQSVTFTATVSATAPGTGTPTGTIQFKVDGTNLGTPVAMVGGSATSPATTTLAVGTRVITADYSGDVGFNTSTGTVNQGVGANASATVIASSSNPSVFGQSVSFTATVVGSGGTPTGTVQFTVDGTNLGTPVPVTGGVATSQSTAALAVGNHPVSAAYSGDGSFNASNGTLSGGQVVTATATSTAVASSQNPATFGQSVTFTATVTSNAPGAGIPTGTIQFSIDGSNAGTPVNLVGGVATFATATLTSGNHSVAASYSGATSFAASNGTLGGGQNVNPAASTTAVVSSSNPSVSGESISFTATVTSAGGTPTGSVQFQVDGSNFGTPVTVNGTGQATSAATTTLTVGAHPVTAIYSPTGTSFSGSSGTLAGGQTVNAASTTTAVSSSVNPSTFGQSVIFTATVAPVAPGSGTPTGTVQFAVDGSAFGVPVLLVGGVASTPATSALASGNHPVTATYTPSGSSFTGSSGTLAGGQTVNGAGTTTTVASSQNPSVFGQSVTFTATVAVVAPGTGTPTGTVQFAVDGSNLGTPVTLVGGVATSTATAALVAGNHPVTATYTATGGFTGSSGTLAGGQTVNVASTTTAVASSANPSVFGQGVSFTATIAPVAPGAGAPTGAVQFSVDGSSLGTPVTVDGTGHATSTTTAALGVGNHPVTAVFTATGNFAGSSGTLTAQQAVNAAATTTTVASSLNPSIFGQSVTFTATIAPVAPGTGTPTGTVQFAIDGTNFGSPVTLVGGTATSPATTTLVAGNHPVTVAYTPTGNSFTASTGTLAGGQTVSAGGSTTAVTSSVNPSTFGQSVTFTATVNSTSGTPTGTMQFVIDGSNSGSPVALVAGVATQSTAALAAGNHTVSGTYIPTGSFSASSGSLTGGQTVNPASTTTAVSSSSVSSVFGTSVTFTATVAPVAPGAGTPTGTVQFAVDGSNLGTPVTVDGTGHATSQGIATLNVGNHPVTATYTATGSFSGSSGTLPGGQTVTQAPTTTVVASSVNPSVFGQSVTFTANVTSPGGTVSGAVQFSIDASPFGTPVTLVNGLATSPTTSALTVATHTVSASYAATTNFSASSGSIAGGQVVNKANTATAVASSQNPSNFGQSVTFTATVTASAPGTGTPSGTVQFKVDGANLGTPVTLSGGSATSPATTTLAVGTRVVTADYSGDAGFNTSTGTVNQGVGANASAVAISSSSNPSVFGQSITFTATVVGSGGTPTGTVQFAVDGANLGSPVTLSAGIATSPSTATLTVGNHVVTAVYGGDGSFTGSNGTLPGGQVVNKAASATAVATSVSPSVSGQSVSWTATVTAGAPGAGTPTGTIQFAVDGVNLGTPVALVAGVATSIARTDLTVGTHSITAAFSGDGGFNTSLGTLAGGQLVNLASTTTALSSSLNPSVFGQSVTFTATVAPVAPGAGTPTGSVQFQVDGSNFGSPVTLVGGTATSPASTTLAAGNHPVTATYTPTGTSFSGSSGTLAGGQTVTAGGTTTAVTSSVNPSVFGQSVTFTATVTSTSGTPTGTVQFAVDGTNLGTPVTLVGGVATSTATAALAAGNHPVTATYAPTGSFGASSGTLAGGQTVNTASTTTAVASSANPAVFGQGVSFTATVAPVAPGAGTPTGSVQFSVDGGNLGTPVTVDGTGHATSPITNTLSVANHPVTAVFTATGNFVGSSGTLAGGQNVNASATTTAVSSSLNPSIFGQSVTFTATVAAVAPGSGTPTGSIQFAVDGTNLGSPVVLVSGAATSPATTSLGAGNHPVTATYAPTGTGFSASSGTLAGGQTVNAGGTTTALTSSVNPSTFGQSVTFTATLTSTSGTPTGTVQFVVDGTNSGTPVALVAGVATQTTAALAAGNHTVSGTYIPTGSFSASNGSLSGGQTVNPASTTTGVSSSSVSSVFGTSVTFTATVAPVAPGAGTPTGTVQFAVDGSNFGTPVTLVAGVATSPATSTLNVGNHPVTANYTATGSFTSSSGTLPGGQTVTPAPTTTAVAASVNPSVFGQSVSFTANVTSPGGTVSGAVQFSIDASPFGTPVTLVNGAATSTATSALAVANHTVSAAYAATTNFSASSGSVTGGQVVNKANAATAIASSKNPSSFGESVTFTATVTASAPGTGTPSGTVQFKVDGANLGTPVTLTGGSATSPATTTLAVGTRVITADYSGDAGFNTSTGTLNQGVGANASATVIASSANPSVFGQSITFTATVVGSGGTPTGTVQFAVDGANLGSPVTLSAGIATSPSTATLTVGNHVVSAVYGGDGNFTGSNGTLTGGQVVNKAASNTAVASSVNPAVSGQSVSWTATVTAAAPGAGSPTGTIQFAVDGVNLGTPVTLVAGVATSTARSDLTVGTHSITANYSGDGDFNSGVGTLASQTVNAASTTTAVASSLTPSVFGQSVSFTATVAVAAPGTGTPTGSIQFQVDGSNFGTPVTLVGGTATSSATTTLAVGIHPVTATYTPTGTSFSGSSGTLAGGQAVTAAATATAVASSANPSTFGQSISFTATVTSTAGTPTGTVQFQVDGSNFGSPVTLIAGVATSQSTSALAAGNHPVTATYSGAANFAVSSGTLGGGQTVNASGTTTVVSASPSNTTVFGQSVSFSATVSSGGGTPTGTVQFAIDGSNFGTPVSLVSGAATSSATAALAVGNHAITATYSPTGSFTASSGTLSGGQTVNAAGTTTTVASSANPSVFGQSVTFTAAVSVVAPGSGTPTGTVQFLVDGSNFGTPVTLDGTGHASSQATTTLASGNHSVTANYSATGGFSNSSGGLAGGQNVSSGGTATALASSANPSAFGQSITFTATVTSSSGTPTGTVQFLVDGSNFGTAVTLVGGVATSGATSALGVGNHPVSANYIPTGSFSASSGSLSGGQVVNTASTTTAVASSQNPSTFGQSVSFTATVAAVAPGTGTPTGSVQFAVDASNLGTPVALVAGVATSPATTTLASGNHAVTATYSASGGFSGSNGTLAGGQTVNAASTTTALASSVNPSVFGQGVSFTATVSVVAPGGGTPTGSVQFAVDGSNLGSAVTLVGGAATSPTTTNLAVGNHAVTATYTATGSFTGSNTTLAGGQTVNKSNSSTTIASSANPSNFGQSVTFTATVSATAPGAGTPTGTVQFKADGANLGAAVALTGGVATTSTSTLAVGTRVITADYSGDGNYNISTGSLNQGVGSSATAVAVASSANPSLTGQTVSFTAAVSGAGGTPTGTVQFTVDGTNFGTPVTLVAGSATSPSTSTLAVGSHPVTAIYSGDGTFTGSTGTLPGGQTVNAAATTMAVSSSANPSTFGQSVTFTSVVNVTAPGAGPATGTVQFVVDATNFGSPVTLVGGVASSPATTTLAGGNHPVSATYTPSGGFVGTSGTLASGQTVNKAASTTAVASSVNPSVVGQAVSWTATVTAGATGTIQFAVDGVNLGAPVTLVGGSATSASRSDLTVGSHAVTASYSGDGNFNTSSGTLTGGQTVNAASTTTALSSSQNPSTFGQSVTFTATVATVAPGTGTPTGTVQFAIDGSNFGSPVTLAAGTATSGATTTLTSGSHPVTATYTPTGTSFSGSNGTLAGGQTVNAAGTTTAVASSANPSTFGQSVSFTATVTSTAGTPTGSVQFAVDGANLGSPVALVGGVANSGATTTLVVGNHPVSATYTPTGGFAASSGNLTGGQTVNSASTTTAVASSQNPSTFGQSISFTATVAVVAPGAGTPTGTVQFAVDGGNLGTPVTLDGTGHATSQATSTLASGNHPVTATYSGTGGFSGSSGTLAGGQTVNAASTTTAVATTANPAAFGQAVLYTATVSVVAPGTGTPSGTIQFAVDGSNLGTPVTLVNGVASSTSIADLTVGNHPVTATYSPTGSFSGSTGTLSGGQTVNIANSSTAVASSLNPSTFGDAVSFTATVTPVAPSGLTPTGTVQFRVDGSALGTPVALVAGSATSSSTTSLALGTRVITAQYSGDAGFNGSTGTLNQGVGSTATAVAISSSSNPSVFGQTVSFTAVVTATSGTPTGTVQFQVDGANLGSPITLNGGNAVSPTTSSLTIGNHSVTAAYTPTGTFAASSGTMSGGQTVTAAGTTTAVASSANPSTFGQSITFTATVAVVAPGSGTPTGTVQFAVDGGNLGSPVTLVSGSATSSATSSLGAGNHSVTATYTPGVTSFSGSSGTLAGGQTVNKTTATIAVASSAVPSVWGQTVTWTTTVTGTGGTPTGTVQIAIDGVNLGSPVTLVAGVATSIGKNDMSVFNHAVSASYSGDANFNSGVGNLAGGQIVNPASTSVAVNSSLNPSVFGQSVTFTTTVTVVAPGTGTPPGSVQFAIDGTNFGSPVTLVGGTATSPSTTTLGAGNHSVTVAYTPTGNSYSGNTGSLAGGQTVDPGSTTTAVASSLNPSTFGQGVNFTATVTSTSGTPTGSVQFSVDGGDVGAPVALISGSATAPAITTLAAGNHPVTGTYIPSANFTASSGTLAGGQTVNAANTTTAVSSSSVSSVFGTSVTFTATVAVVSPGVGTPTGTVQFAVDGSNFGAPVAVDGTGHATSQSISTLEAGNHPVTATYTATGSFNGSNGSLPGGQTVTPAGTITTVSSSLNPSNVGDAVTFTATLTSAGGTPTGTVQFFVDAVAFGSPVTLVGGVASSQSTTTLTAGNHSVGASYVATGSFTNSSGSLSGGQTVNTVGPAPPIASLLPQRTSTNPAAPPRR